MAASAQTINKRTVPLICACMEFVYSVISIWFLTNLSCSGVVVRDYISRWFAGLLPGGCVGQCWLSLSWWGSKLGVLLRGCWPAITTMLVLSHGYKHAGVGQYMP